MSLHFAARPVDINHTYGHEKIEYFSSGLEGLLMLGAAVVIFGYAVRRLYDPGQLQALDLGLGVHQGARAGARSARLPSLASGFTPTSFASSG